MESQQTINALAAMLSGERQDQNAETTLVPNPETNLSVNGTPKTTQINPAKSGISLEVIDGFTHIIIDETKHQSFTNAKGDIRTYAKVSGLDLGNGKTLNLVLKGKDAAQAAAQLTKDITRKVKLWMREKATEKDIDFLLSHGFAGEDGKLDAGKIECKYADILMAEAKAKAAKDLADRNKRNAEKVAEMNGSLQQGEQNAKA